MMNLLGSARGFFKGKKTIATLVGGLVYMLMCNVTATEPDPEIMAAFFGSSVFFAKLGQFRANKKSNGA